MPYNILISIYNISRHTLIDVLKGGRKITSVLNLSTTQMKEESYYADIYDVW